MAQIPAGLGSDKVNTFNRKQFRKIIEKGVPYLVYEEGIGTKEILKTVRKIKLLSWCIQDLAVLVTRLPNIILIRPKLPVSKLREIMSFFYP